MHTRRRGFTLVELGTVVAVVAVLISMLLPAIQASREAARRTQCANNLHQISLALASYEATYRVLPAGSVDGSPAIDDALSGYRFGWIPAILPYLERRNLCNQLNFGQGVYAPSQDTARLTVVITLLCPSDGQGARPAASGSLPPHPRSFYAACHHHRDEPIRADNQGAFPLNGWLGEDDFPDGRATTILIGEKRAVGDEAGWAVGSRATLRNTGLPLNQTHLPALETMLVLQTTPPEAVAPEVAPPDLVVTPTSPGYPPVGGFGSQHPAGANFVFADGSVRFVLATLPLDLYQRLGHRNDGGLISEDSY